VNHTESQVALESQLNVPNRDACTQYRRQKIWRQDGCTGYVGEMKTLRANHGISTSARVRGNSSASTDDVGA
jgi:hypothetical protein